jgi:MarR family transcriptional regulator, transcriptional regulator for hemolysin
MLGCQIIVTQTKPPASEPVLRQLVFVAKEIRQAFEQALEEAGGSLGTWIVLSAISDEVGFISHRILASRAHVDGATITYHVDRAEALGLVVREVDPGDRRVKRLRLTPAGIALHKRLMAEVDRLATQSLTGVSKSEREQLRKTLDKVRANLTQ